MTAAKRLDRKHGTAGIIPYRYIVFFFTLLFLSHRTHQTLYMLLENWVNRWPFEKSVVLGCPIFLESCAVKSGVIHARNSHTFFFIGFYGLFRKVKWKKCFPRFVFCRRRSTHHRTQRDYGDPQVLEGDFVFVCVCVLSRWDQTTHIQHDY